MPKKKKNKSKPGLNCLGRSIEDSLTAKRLAELRYKTMMDHIMEMATIKKEEASIRNCCIIYIPSLSSIMFRLGSIPFTSLTATSGLNGTSPKSKGRTHPGFDHRAD